MFDRSLLKVIEDRPWRYTTPPTFNPDGTQATAGVKSAPLDGVFILISDELVELLASALTQTEKDELRSWIFRRTEVQAGEWHVPVWAGQSSSVYLRIPATIWNDPTGAPPLKVRRYFQHLYRAVTT